jgi:hypothetical protein
VDLVAKAVRILKTSGRVGKATAALSSQPLCVMDETTEGQLRRLFPPRIAELTYPADVWEDDRYRVRFSKTVVQETLESRDKHTAR